MSLQDDSEILKIDHSDYAQSSFIGGRGSTHVAPPSSLKPKVSEKNVPLALEESRVNLQTQPVAASVLPTQPTPILPSQAATAIQQPAAVEAIYASGDSAKIQAWEQFVAAKTNGTIETPSISVIDPGINSAIPSSVDAPSALDNQATRINDKSMSVNSRVEFRESPLNGGAKPTQTSDTLN